MRTTDENILRLLEMLDNPDAYTEQEIHDIINSDEDTRETYRLMVEAKQSSRHRRNDEPVDVETAWQRFISSEKSKVTREELASAQPTEQPHSSFFTLHSSFQKMAASFIGVLLVSGIAFAAIHLVRRQQTTETTQTEVTPPTKEPVREPVMTAPVDTFVSDTAIVQPVTYDNIPLEKMLPEIAIPYEHEKVIARISYVGYTTVYRLCTQPEVGTIRLRPDTYTVGGVVVQGERPKVQLQGNSLMMNIEGTVMERLGTAEDVLQRVPTISKKGEGYEILGKGTPLIYVNSRKLTDLNELRNIASDNIRNPYFEGRAGFNYQIDGNNSFGGFYQHIYDYVKTSGYDDDELIADGARYDHLTNQSVKRAQGLPRHQVNLYYTGKIGKTDIDFNADYTFRRQHNRTEQQELSSEYDNRDVNTDNLTRGKMVAEKLIVSHPLWKGTMTAGEEYTYTQWTNEFQNDEGYIANSDNEQHESNIAPFVELRQQLGRFQLQAGLRYEHVVSDYYVGGIRRDDQSRTYDILFPSLSASTSIPLAKDKPGNDLFNDGINRFTLYSNHMMFRKKEDNDSRCIQLSLRYRFNVTPSKYRGTGAGNAEKDRL